MVVKLYPHILTEHAFFPYELDDDVVHLGGLRQSLLPVLIVVHQLPDALPHFGFPVTQQQKPKRRDAGEEGTLRREIV